MRKWIIAFTLVFLALLALNLVPALRGGAGWQWPYAAPDRTGAVALLAALLVAYVGGAALLRQRDLPDWLLLLWAVASGAGLALGVLNVQGNPFFLLFARSVSPVQTGASTVAVQIMAQDGVVATLQRWPDVMREAWDRNIIHFTTSPPGQALLHYWVAELFDRLPGLARPISRALRIYQCNTVEVMNYTNGEIASVGFVGMLMPLWTALTAVPVYVAAKAVSGQRDLARRISQWWPLVPSALLFAPTFNTVFALFAAASFALLALALAQRKGWIALLSGLVMSMLTLLNFSAMPLLLLFGLYTLGYWFFVAREDRRPWWWPVLIGVWFGAGLASLWGVFWVVSGHSPVELFLTSMELHRQIVTGRSTLAWLFLHPYDTLMFAGWPLAALALWSAGRGVWNLLKKQPATPADVFGACLLVMLVALDLSGTVQGENARILIFLIPFLLVAAASVLKEPPGWDLPLLAAQAATVGVMAAVLPVVPLDMNPMAAAPREDIGTLDRELVELPGGGATFTSDDYGGSFTLTGYRFVADPAQQALTFELNWQGIDRTERPYTFELVATAENDIDGVVVSEPHRWQAQSGNYPPTCWRDGDVIRDVVVMDLPGVSEPVVWDVILRAVDERTGDVMAVTLPDGSTSDGVTLGPVNYP